MGSNTDARELHPLNALLFIADKSSGSNTETNEEQSQNVLRTICDTFEGMVIAFSDSQPSNTPSVYLISPIVVKLFGNEIYFSDRQFLKAPPSIVVIPSEISTDCRPDPANAHPSMHVKLLGILIDFRFSQSLNVSALIHVTLLGIFIEVRLLQSEYLLLVDYQYYTL